MAQAHGGTTGRHPSHNKAIGLAVAAAVGGFLFGFDSSVINGAVDAIQGQFDLGAFRIELEPVVGHYLGENARTGNSFLNASLAAGNGWGADRLLQPGYAYTQICGTEMPLVCENKNVRPAVALIMIGTNDSGGVAPEVYTANLRRIVRHEEPERADRPELDAAQQILAQEAARREALFQESVAAEKTRGDALSKRFEEALRKAREEPITKPTRDFDLD